MSAVLASLRGSCGPLPPSFLGLAAVETLQGATNLHRNMLNTKPRRPARANTLRRRERASLARLLSCSLAERRQLHSVATLGRTTIVRCGHDSPTRPLLRS